MATKERDTRGPIRIGAEIDAPDLNAQVRDGATDTPGASISADNEREFWREKAAKYRRDEAERYARQAQERLAREREKEASGGTVARSPSSRSDRAQVELSSHH